MTDTPELTSDPDLAAAVWDLEPLVDGQGDAGVETMLTEARTLAGAFVTAYGGVVRHLDPDGLVSAATQLEQIHSLLLRADAYAFLRGAANSADAEAGALRGAVEAARAEIDAQLLFFDLEWVGLDDARAEALLAGGGEPLSFAAHHLRRLRARRPHLLSSEQEEILAATSVQRRTAWQRLYMESAGTLTVELDGETLPLSQVFDVGLIDPDRGRRQAMLAAGGEAVRTGLPTRVAAYNQVLGDCAVTDRLRGYPTWLSARNDENGLTDAVVELQLATIDAHADTAQRWYRLKARLLGVERLAASDLWAPLPGDGRTVSFARSREIVCAAWAAFAPSAGEIVTAFFDDRRIDAPMRMGKEGGAFSQSAGPSRHPYILVNYEGRPASTMTLAHELGHGLHQELARTCGALQCEGSSPLAEVASTFSEALVAERISADADDVTRLALLAGRLDAAMLCVFETRAQVRAEAAMHAHRRERGELTAAQLSELWTAAYLELWEDAVEPDAGYLSAWAFIPHLIWEPGYNQSYSFGLLAALSAFARYQQVGDPFAEDYLAMLAAGGSRSPSDLLAMLGLELGDPGFWNAGLDLLDGMLSEAERLSAAR